MARLPFTCGVGMHGQCVQACRELRREQAIDLTVSRYPADTFETCGYEHHLEVCFRTRRHMVAAAFVGHFEVLQGQCTGEGFFNTLCSVHRQTSPARP